MADVDGSQVFVNVNGDVFEKPFEFFISYFLPVGILVKELLDF